MAALPPCPRGHEGTRTGSAGVQRRDGRERQRYRCTALDGSYHRFIGALALARDDIKYGDPVRDLLHQSLHSLAEWDAFAYAVRANPEWVSANKWVKHWDKRMRAQTARRASLPPVYASGAVEAPIKRVRAALERRRWTFRNRERMNLQLLTMG